MFSTHAYGPSLRELAHDADVLTMGITPSADHLHQGHYLTLFNLLKTLSETRTAKARIFLDDREFNNQKEPSIPSDARIDGVGELVTTFAQDAGAYLHDPALADRVQLQLMSDFFREPGADHPSMSADMFRLLTKEWQEGISLQYRGTLKKLFRTFCPECNIGKLKRNNMRTQPAGIRNVCTEDGCDTSEYIVSTMNGDTNWAIHYALIGLRDVPLSRRDDASIVHVYGGDYNRRWGANDQSPKGLRMSRAVDHLRGKKYSPPIHHYAGPLILKQGGKLSKSKGDKLDTADFEWLESVLNGEEATVDIVESGSEH